MKKRKGIDGKLDIAWSKLIKLRAGMKCEYCGKTTYLNSHHLFTRSKKSTRWSVDNGICLCVGHHTFSSTFSAHLTPIEFTYWLEEYKGKKFINNLRLKANGIKKYSKFEKETLLQYFKEEIDKYS